MSESVMTTGERLRARRRAEAGIVPLTLAIDAPEPVQPVTRPKRPRIALTQPTDAGESATLKALKIRENRCEFCGTTFPTTMPHQVVCSDECRRAKKASYQRQARSAARASKPATILCPVCSKPIQVDTARRGQHRRRFCSSACRHAQTYRNKRAGLRHDATRMQ